MNAAIVFFSLSVGLLVQLYPQVEVDVKVESEHINCFSPFGWPTRAVISTG